MKPIHAAIVIVTLAVILVLSSSMYVVREWEQVVITQFGDPVGDPISEAGLHFKTPFVQDVNRFDRRILIWDGKKNEITTADKRFIWVDTTARWRIADPLLFLQAVRTERGAQGKLDGVLDSATRSVISAHKLTEAVRLTNRVLDLPPEPEEQEAGLTTTSTRESIERGRDRLVEDILELAKELTPQYGIELIDVRIKRINYVEKVRRAVYDRMISERQRIAERYRSQGQGRKLEVEGQRVAEEKRISSTAFRDAQETIAKADAEAARIYAEAYGSDAEFYAFWRTLKAYEAIIGSNHTLVISPDSDMYRYLAHAGVTK